MLGYSPPAQTPYDSSNGTCSNSIWLLMGYVGATLLAIECIDKVLQISSQTLGRAMAFAGITGRFVVFDQCTFLFVTIFS